jgi:hypothetical protein
MPLEFYYLGLSKAALSFFYCRPSAPETDLNGLALPNFIYGHSSITCSSSEYQSLIRVGIAGAILYAFGIPFSQAILYFMIRPLTILKGVASENEARASRVVGRPANGEWHVGVNALLFRYKKRTAGYQWIIHARRIGMILLTTFLAAYPGYQVCYRNS